MPTIWEEIQDLTGPRLTPQFTHWLDRLKDSRDVAKIKAHLIQMEAGSFGNVKPCGEDVSESRIHYGPRYRVYFIQPGAVFEVVLGVGVSARGIAILRLSNKLYGLWRTTYEAFRAQDVQQCQGRQGSSGAGRTSEYGVGGW
ncbi:type II toxin-antitoxin system RelE/ParE family toxin [Acetobacter estunensis]|uniref:type II toxin-antitoxin system RelE/ParE family toxin n=1 Tax=Acetobacter estunensis TaxID=104097 RepID=UPI0035713A8C